VEIILAVLNIAVLVGFAVVVLLAKKYLPAYAAKKAENLATKEDIGQITDTVERVKAAHAADIERLKSALEHERAERRAADERINHIHRVQFETEFRVLSEIWAALALVRARVGMVRPAMRIVEEGETDEQRLERTFNAFVEAKNDFVKKVDFNMPFYPQNLHDALSNIIKLLGAEYLDVKGTEPDQQNAEWWHRGSENFTAINQRVENVATLIRERLASLVVR
jgi:hypothetical protein